jgi:D-lactate dehydrogenase (cytochrome)
MKKPEETSASNPLRGKTLPATVLSMLQDQFDSRLSTSHGERLRHGECETHFDTIMPDAVIHVLNTDEVASAVRICSENQIPIVAFGAGTSMEGHTIPVEGGISLDLPRMDRIVGVNPEDLDCTVEAGVRREQLNKHLRDLGLFFPIDPGANATIGGMVATRASGTNAVRYGTMRDAVLALTVVTAKGEIVRTSQRARKSAAGYDLTRLFTGSEGTLGIITEVTLRLHGIPEQICAAVCPFDTLDGAVATVTTAIQLGLPIARIELLDDKQIMAVNRWSGTDFPNLTTLFFEFHGTSAGVEEQITIVRELASANGGGEFRWSNLPEERNQLWKARHNAFYATKGLRPGCRAWTSDVCVPVGALARCIAETKADIDSSFVPATIVGHVGDGNFHVIFAMGPDDQAELREVERLNARMVARAIDAEGTCTGEHGVGLGKRQYLVDELGGAVEIMRTIKRALDPYNILNPGKIFL